MLVAQHANSNVNSSSVSSMGSRFFSPSFLPPSTRSQSSQGCCGRFTTWLSSIFLPDMGEHFLAALQEFMAERERMIAENQGERKSSPPDAVAGGCSSSSSSSITAGASGAGHSCDRFTSVAAVCDSSESGSSSHGLQNPETAPVGPGFTWLDAMAGILGLSDEYRVASCVGG